MNATVAGMTDECFDVIPGSPIGDADAVARETLVLLSNEIESLVTQRLAINARLKQVRHDHKQYARIVKILDEPRPDVGEVDDEPDATDEPVEAPRPATVGAKSQSTPTAPDGAPIHVPETLLSDVEVRSANLEAEIPHPAELADLEALADDP